MSIEPPVLAMAIHEEVKQLAECLGALVEVCQELRVQAERTPMVKLHGCKQTLDNIHQHLTDVWGSDPS